MAPGTGSGGCFPAGGSAHRSRNIRKIGTDEPKGAKFVLFLEGGTNTRARRHEQNS